MFSYDYGGHIQTSALWDLNVQLIEIKGRCVYFNSQLSRGAFP